MKNAILFANCQGGPLARLLCAHPAFSERWQLSWQVNYSGDGISPEAMAGCDLFLYQHLGEKWKDSASQHLLGLLPSRARALCLPNLFFKGYWPLWIHGSSMNFGDMFLDKLTDQGLTLAEIARVYLNGPLARMYDLDDLLARSVKMERERESHAFFQLVDYVLEHWRERRLFDTVNHPAPELTWLMGDTILRELGLPGPAPLAELEAAGLDLRCDSEFELPIHPLVAEHFGLNFGHEGQRYAIYGKSLTFREYMVCYVDCRRRGGINFLEYLQAVSF